MKILIIEDDLDTRTILSESLRSAGYEVAAAKDGEEGLHAVRVDKPSLVITDILMPGVDGFHFLSEVRKDSSLKDLPVIFYTGNYLDEDDEQLAQNLGVSKFLIKPMTPQEIIAVVNELLEVKAKDNAPQVSHSSLDEPVFLKLYNERLVTKLKHKIIENDDSRRSLENIMEGIADGVLVIDMDHTIIRANSAVAASMGLKKPGMIGRKCYEVMHRRQTPCEGPYIVCPLPHILGQEDNNIKLLHTHYDGNGNERHIEITASPVKNAKGRTIAMVETLRDIMEKYSDDELVKLVKRLNQAQTHLKHMAITDDLTGLRNRRYIIERLEEEFQRAKRSGDHLSLIMLDIDHFKQINDAHGHLFGDVVLRVIAMRIKLILRIHDIVGRVGGEEFLVICPESALGDTVIVAERIRKIINDELIGDGVKELRVALSAGVTELHENDVSFEKLFSRADLALYKAKEEGRNRVVTL
jgi:diguanylate cyclase (GGDEF)-like protein/PAS domain S-box-containing protein